MKRSPAKAKNHLSPDFVDFDNVDKFIESLQKNPELAQTQAEDIVLYLFDQNNTDLFAAFLENGLDPQLKIGNPAKSMLIYLAENQAIDQRVAFIKAILDSKAADFEYKYDFLPQAVLRYAIAKKDEELFKMFLENPKVDLTCGFGSEDKTALFSAIALRNLDYAQILLDRELSFVQNIKFYPRSSYYENLVFCLRENGEILSDPDWQGFIRKVFSIINSFPKVEENFYHPLLFHYIGYQSDKNPNSLLWLKTIVELSNINIDAQLCGTGYTLATQSGNVYNTDFLRFLKAKGADFDKGDISGRTPAFYAYSIEDAKVVLTDKNINILDKYGISPLQNLLLRTYRLRFDLVLYFIDKGANLVFKSGNIFHYLSEYVENKRHSLSAIFLEKIFERVEASEHSFEALFSQIDEKGRTPLEKACYENKTELFKILLAKANEKGINNINSEKILFQAIEGGSEEIVSCVISQEKNLKNLISKEILSELLEKYLSSKSPSYDVYIKRRKCLNFLTEVIEKFDETENLANIADDSAASVESSPSQSANMQNSQSANSSFKTFVDKWFKIFVVLIEKFINKICMVFGKNPNIQSGNKQIPQQETTQIDNPSNTRSTQPVKKDSNISRR